MNKLIEYVLPNLWGCIKNIKNKYHLGYMILPLLYLVVIANVVNTLPEKEVIHNTLAINTMDSYTKIDINNDVKREEILNKYNLSAYEFNVVCAIVLAEAEYNSYDDAYAVINTIYNRTKSNRWIKSVDNKFGSGKGKSLYYQAISPRQFTVYEHGSYKKYLNDTTSVGYNAIIDFLYTEKILHNYLSFRSNSIKVAGSVSFSENGNNYFNEI